MSLDELLKDSKDSPAWRQQRKKLFRVVAGLGIIALALAASAVFVSLKSERRGDEGAESLARLMGIKKEAEGLQEEIDQLKKETSTNGRGQANSKRRPATLPDANVRPQIINYDPGDGFARVTGELPDLYIPTGAVFIAQLITPIKTSVERTFVMAEVIHEFRMDLKRRIAKGSRLIGRSRLNPVLKGVIVEFETLVSPAGIESSLSGLALSRNALPEIDGLYFSNKLETYGTALAFGFLSGFSSAAQEREPTIYGSQPEVSLSNQVLAGLSTASFQVAENILRDIRERSVEYVIIPAGEQIFIALTTRYDVNQKNQGGSQ